jgi:tetratricopeptide (TPR) repeat protein
MRSLSGPSLAIVAMLAVSSSIGCSRVGQLQAMRSFKSANQAYAQQDYQKAAELYEEAVKADPNLAEVYFYLGNSYDNMWKPSRKGEPDNDVLLEKAVANYQLSAEKLSGATEPAKKNLARLSLEYLVATYREDKLNDPAKAEPVLQKMIQEEPEDPNNYFALARLYEDAGVYAEAEQIYLKAKEVKPNDPNVYLQLAGYYNRQGPELFPKTIEALEERAKIEPNNPEAFQTIAGYYWDEARLDARLTDAQRREYILKGLEAVDKALTLRADFVEALTFKGLLLRLQANVEKDPAKQQALLKEAVQLSDKANELRKQQRGAGASN